MFIDQNPYAHILHVGLCLIGFQFFLCAFGVGLVFCNKELPSGLVILCFCGDEPDCLIVVFGKLGYSVLYFLFPVGP